MKHNTIYRLKRYTLLWIICICIASGNAQASKSPLYFYGAVSVSGDDAVIKLTQDLFFSQLEALDLFDIQDRRQTVYSTNILKQHANTSDLLFYAQIYEKKGEWVSVLHLVEAATGKEAVTEKQYDGYYKILMEAKNSLASLIKDFGNGETSQAKQVFQPQTPNTENLSGTWYGEEYIDKIILLRGGRGFVIFKNGASMNISVTISGKTLTALQQSKPNASFFPEIPREAALINAVNAEPVRWEMTIESESAMSGVKYTLVEAKGSELPSVTQGSINVRWRR